METVIQRDLAALADIRKVAALPRLLRWTGPRSAEARSTCPPLPVGWTWTAPRSFSYLEWLRAVLPDHPGSGLAAGPHRQGRPSAQDISHTTPASRADLIGAYPDGLAAPAPPGHRAAHRDIRDKRDRPADHGLRPTASTCTTTAITAGHECGPDPGKTRRDDRRRRGEKATRSPTAAQLNHVRWLRDKIDRAAPRPFQSGDTPAHRQPGRYGRRPAPPAAPPNPLAT